MSTGEENLSVKDWYMETYPTDDIVAYMPDKIRDIQKDLDLFDDLIAENPSYANKPITFETYFTVLDNRRNVYRLMGGAADSLVRERIFNKLAEIMQVDCDYIYDQWMLSSGD